MQEYKGNSFSPLVGPYNTHTHTCGRAIALGVVEASEVVISPMCLKIAVSERVIHAPMDREPGQVAFT